MELLDYLPSGWSLETTHHGLMLLAPDREDGKDFLAGAARYLRETAQNIRGVIEVRAATGDPIASIQPALSTQPQTVALERALIRSATDLDWNAIQKGRNPVYITQLHDQHNLFLNQVAVMAQSGKPPAEFLSTTAHTLNFEDELRSRCAHIQSDHSLSEYSYEALRWFRDDAGVWIRRRMTFFSNFWRVEYLGQDCWLGEVLQATPLDQFVDHQ